MERQNFLVVGGRGAVGRAFVALALSKGIDSIMVTSDAQLAQRAEGHVYLDLCQPATITAATQSFDTPLCGILIASGYEPSQSLAEMTTEHLARMVAVHLTGPLLLIQAFRPFLQASSSIALISSVAAWKGSYDPAYAMVKSGVVGLVRTLARELAPNTRVNAIAPGLIADSPVFHRMTDDFRQRHQQAALTGDIATPQQIAETILFLHHSPLFTGAVLHPNCGQYNV
jgi:3-oxoacyl-[acyl-carrier protein] reductase